MNLIAETIKMVQSTYPRILVTPTQKEDFLEIEHHLRLEDYQKKEKSLENSV